MLAAERHPNRLQRPLEGGLRCQPWEKPARSFMGVPGHS